MRRGGRLLSAFSLQRQILLVLMDELLESLSRLDLRPKGQSDVREGLRTFLTRALSADLKYLGAYRAWREAVKALDRFRHAFNLPRIV